MATIVCVEDEKAIRHDLVEVISSAGHKVLEACDGREGLKIIVDTLPDMVVSDITMPVMGGYELLTELREKHTDLAEMPFIFLSALADRQEVLAGMNHGADDYLTKPVDFELLESKIRATLRQVKRMRAMREQQFAKFAEVVKQREDDPNKDMALQWQMNKTSRLLS